MRAHLFTLKHFLLFGLLSIASTILTIYFQINVQANTVNGTEGLALMWVITSLFWGVYAALLIKRWLFIKTITFTTRHNMHVITNGFDVDQSEVEKITDETATLWENATKWKGCSKAVRKELFLVCKPYPVQHLAKLDKVAGYTVGTNMIVGFKKDQPVADTAFAHELGHIIYYAKFKSWSEADSHAYMRRNKLP